jgi:hypothetical protein
MTRISAMAGETLVSATISSANAALQPGDSVNLAWPRDAMVAMEQA